MSSGGVSSLNVTFESCRDKLDKMLREMVRKTVNNEIDSLADAIIEDLKQKYSVYANDNYILLQIFEKWHARDFLGGFFPVLVTIDSCTFDFGLMKPFNQVIDAVKSKLPGDTTTTEFIEARKAYIDFKYDGHGGYKSHKPEDYKISGISCNKAEYERLKPHLGILFLTMGVTFSEPSAETSSKGLAKKNKNPSPK